MTTEDPCATTLQFLFSKRLELFNVRRQHEWQVLIGVVVALGAVDFALMQSDVRSGSIQLVWTATLCILFAAVYMYEFGVQERNRVDRLALDELNGLLCDSAERTGPGERSVHLRHARLLIDGETLTCKPSDEDHILRSCYLWAFRGQMLVLLTACVVSAVVPFVSRPAPGSAGATQSAERALIDSTVASMALGGVTIVFLFGWTLWRSRVTSRKQSPGGPELQAMQA